MACLKRQKLKSFLSFPLIFSIYIKKKKKKYVKKTDSSKNFGNSTKTKMGPAQITEINSKLDKIGF